MECGFRSSRSSPPAGLANIVGDCVSNAVHRDIDMRWSWPHAPPPLVQLHELIRTRALAGTPCPNNHDNHDNHNTYDIYGGTEYKTGTWSSKRTRTCRRSRELPTATISSTPRARRRGTASPACVQSLQSVQSLSPGRSSMILFPDPWRRFTTFPPPPSTAPPPRRPWVHVALASGGRPAACSR